MLQKRTDIARAQLSTLFHVRFGSDPYEWQLDVTEAILLGLDSIVIAGTSSGKTIPFMLPLLLDDKKKVLILSPLKVLQDDQVSPFFILQVGPNIMLQTERFEKMQLSAAAVNGDTWSPALQQVRYFLCLLLAYAQINYFAQNLKDGHYRAILTLPEMCLKHDPFRNVLTSMSFQDICMVIVDEAHCIAQWGGDFRTAYGKIGKLRAFFPPHISILAMSVTLTASALLEVHSQLSIDADDCFFLNLGNDCPNIAYSVHPMNSATDYESLLPLLTNKPEPSTPDDLIKSLVFVNKVLPAQLTARVIRAWLPKHLRKYVDYMHAHRTPKARRRAM